MILMTCCRAHVVNGRRWLNSEGTEPSNPADRRLTKMWWCISLRLPFIFSKKRHFLPNAETGSEDLFLVLSTGTPTGPPNDGLGTKRYQKVHFSTFRPEIKVTPFYGTLNTLRFPCSEDYLLVNSTLASNLMFAITVHYMILNKRKFFISSQA